MKLAGTSFPSLALAGLLILLGHDLLMAADPHASAGSHADAPVHYEQASTGCGVQEAARPSSHDDTQRHLPVVLLPAPGHEAGWSHMRSVPWEVDPSHPPDVLRALLQVFLN